MKYQKILAFVFSFLFPITLLGQKVTFGYDENGNRISRTLEVERLNSNSFSFPVLNQKTLRSAEFSKTNETAKVEKAVVEELKSESEEIRTNVYPNPNRGILKIDIANLPVDSKNELRIYDLNGLEKMLKKDFGQYSEIDISSFKDGVYILRININGKFYDWKVLKNSK